jgi:hypothetical protein
VTKYLSGYWVQAKNVVLRQGVQIVVRVIPKKPLQNGIKNISRCHDVDEKCVQTNPDKWHQLQKIQIKRDRFELHKKQTILVRTKGWRIHLGCQTV